MGVRFRRAFIAVLWAVLLPSAAYAQASLTGVVKDTSGAVLPGVTVEASSPALIEKVRSGLTDGSGQYRIENLRPGQYTVTFTLTGFSTVKRAGVELSGSLTTSVNADLRVGSLEETITVTGATPIVDVQTMTKQQVMTSEVIDAIPTAKQDRDLALLVPGVLVSGTSSASSPTTQDVGGATPMGDTSMIVHGSVGGDQRIEQNGLTLGIDGGANASNSTHVSAFQEITIDAGAITADHSQGGVRLNLIPKDGGNAFKGLAFGAYANNSMQGNNYTSALQAAGLGSPTALKSIWDYDAGLGGPIKKDRLWFYATGRYNGTDNYPGGIFNNLNANNPNAWTYAPDTTGPQPFNHDPLRDGQVRLTVQANPKNKIGMSWDEGRGCFCSGTISATTAPEAAYYRKFVEVNNFVADWSSPLTNRVLLEAALLQHYEALERNTQPDLNPLMISVTDQGLGNLVYRAPTYVGNNMRDSQFRTVYYRAAVSYITGSHAIKAGFSMGYGVDHTLQKNVGQPLEYRFNNGVPNQITMWGFPTETRFRMDQDSGAYVQDKWTVQRLTVNAGVRLDWYKNSFPAVTLGPAILTPTRDISFTDTAGVDWKDITPRLGLVYDLFGNGKTALKATVNKYMAGLGPADTFGSALAPAAAIVNSATRSWTDTNKNFVPDCNLLSASANGECAAISNTNFGSAVSGTAFDQSLLNGWGKRAYNWEFSTSVQHEILPRTSLDVGYFRRIYGNFFVTDNLAVAPSDYSPFSVTAPANAQLPGGGGNVIPGFYDLNPNKFGIPAANYVTSASSYGTQVSHWNGVDISVNARPRTGVVIAGGLSTGRTLTDNCQILAALPELSPLGIPYCRQESIWLTNAKLLATYMVPKVDVQVSATFQSLPGPQISANWAAPNAVIAPSLGRSLSGNAANATVNLIAPSTVFGDRLNQLDLRFGKILKFGTTRTAINVDVYNALNTNAVLQLNQSFGGATAWQTPQAILVARFLKISAQFNF